MASRILLPVLAAFLLVACGGESRSDSSAAVVDEGPQLGEMIDGRVYCEVAKAKLLDDGTLRIVTWCEQAALLETGSAIVLTDVTGATILAEATVHKVNAEAGAVALNLAPESMLVELQPGVRFLLPVE